MCNLEVRLWSGFSRLALGPKDFFAASAGTPWTTWGAAAGESTTRPPGEDSSRGPASSSRGAEEAEDHHVRARPEARDSCLWIDSVFPSPRSTQQVVDSLPPLAYEKTVLF